VAVIRKVVAGEPATTGEGGQLMARYEQLRLDALAGTGQGWRWGRAVLEHRGVAAWLATWSELEIDVRVPSPAATTDATGSTPGSEQLVAVLAAMALAVATT
jgi:hypothetical protein